MNLRDALIQRKLTTAILLAGTAVLFLAAAVFIGHEVITFRQTLAENSRTIARITAAQSSGAVDRENENDCRKILSKLNSEPSILLAALYARHGKMLARYPESADVRSFPATPVAKEYVIEHGAVKIFVPVRQDDRMVGALYLKWDLSPAYRRFRWDAGILALMLIGSLSIARAILEDRVTHRAAELAAANQELEAFVCSVSHDLRAPLRHIDAYARIVEDEMEKNPAGARRCISRIRVGVQNMGRLMDDLLKLSRLGRVELKSGTVRLNTLVEEVLAELKPAVANRDIEWRIAELPSAAVDPGLIKLVFANLISNAIKFTRPRARAVIEIGAEPLDGATAIFVRDNGVGFNMKDAHKLFGVFQRLHPVEEFEGSGVGLATVQRIVRLHGGTIRVQAELDKGATFHFTLKGIEAARSA
jgi:signal transduction histidine kinase